MRRLRADTVYDALQVFRNRLLDYYALKGRAVERGEKFNEGVPRLKPPKPTYKEAIASTLSVIKNKLSTPEFAKSLERTFQKVGLIESYASDGTPYYTKFQSRKNGSFGADGENVKREDIESLKENSMVAYLVAYSSRKKKM